jgi:hypothetical protein
MRRLLNMLLHRQEWAADTAAAQDDEDDAYDKREGLCAPFMAWLRQAERRPLNLDAELPTELAGCETADALTAAFSAYFDSVRPEYLEGLDVCGFMRELTKDTVAAVKEQRDFILREHTKASVVVSIVKHVPLAWRGDIGGSVLPTTLTDFDEWHGNVCDRYDFDLDRFYAKVVEWYTRHLINEEGQSVAT